MTNKALVSIAAAFTAAQLHKLTNASGLPSIFKRAQVFERIAASEVQRVAVPFTNADGGTMSFTVCVFDRDVEITQVDFAADSVTGASNNTVQLLIGATEVTGAEDVDTGDSASLMPIAITSAAVADGDQLVLEVVATSGATVRGTVIVHYRPKSVPGVYAVTV